MVPGFGQQGYSFTCYDSITNTPFSEVNDVIEDDKGFIWIGSDKGLFRFTGRTFEEHNLRLRSKTIHAFERLNRDTILFVNDLNVFCLHYDGTDVVITPYQKPSANTLHYPNGLFLDRSNNLWISETGDQVTVYATKYRVSRTIPLPKSTPGLTTRTHFAQDSEGIIWLIRHNGKIFRYENEQGKLRQTANKNLNVNAIYEQGDSIWIGAEEGLYLYKTKAGARLENPISLETTLTGISAVNKSPNNSLFIGTKEGKIYEKSSGSLKWTKVFGSNDPHRVVDIPMRSINNIYFNSAETHQEERIWIPHQKGICLLRSPYFENVGSLAHDNVVSIVPTMDSEMLISLGDLHQVIPRGDVFQSRRIEGVSKVTAIAAGAGSVWLANTYSEIIRMNGDYQELKRLDLSERGGSVFYFHNDHQSNVWFCQAPRENPIVGVAKLTPDYQILEYGRSKGLESRILVVDQSSRGELYAAGIGSKTYLYQYHAEQDQFENVSLPMPFQPSETFEVHDLDVDDRGVVWLATTDGLLTYDSESIVRIGTPPVSSQEIRAVCSMLDGSIWASTATNGVVHHHRGRSVLIDESSGLPSLVTSYRCLKKDANNRIWVGTSEGAAYTVATNPQPNLTPTPELKNCIINSKEIELDIEKGITLRGQQRLRLQLITKAYPANDLVHEYRMVPSEELSFLLPDEGWERFNYDDELEIAEVLPGQYQLQMRSKQQKGFRWSMPLQLPVWVKKPIYRDPRFIIGLVLFISLSFWGYTKLFMQKRMRIMQGILTNQQRELEAKEELLAAQTKEIVQQKEEYKEAVSDISILHQLIHEIPYNADWNEIIMAIGKALDSQEGIQAFEIAYVSGTEICYRGYSTKERGNFTYRSKPYNEKTSLTCWAITNKRILIINDFLKEHHLYVQRKSDYLFQSMAFIPFKQRSGKQAILCAYSIDKEQYQEHDILMLRILADYISRSAHKDLE